MGSKSASILKLKELDMNTPVVCVLGDDLAMTNFIQNIPPDWEKISIRTENKEGIKHPYASWGLPFYPNQERDRALVHLGKLNYYIDKINIIVAKGINPHDTIMAGKYLRDPIQGDLIEYVWGPSTVRDVDELPLQMPWEIVDQLRAPTPPFDHNILEAVRRVGYRARRIVPKRFAMPFVLEFSIYPYPVGEKEESLIFWEVVEIVVR